MEATLESRASPDRNQSPDMIESFDPTPGPSSAVNQEISSENDEDEPDISYNSKETVFSDSQISISFSRIGELSF